MIMPDKQTIDNFARESFLRLTNGRENADKEMFYRHGFAEGFKMCAEMERQFARIEKTPIKVHVDLDEIKSFDEISKIDDFKNVVQSSSLKLAQEFERKIFEVMLENKSSQVFVVDCGPQYDGSAARWDAEITCDEERAKHVAKESGMTYNQQDFSNLLQMTDEEFDKLLMETDSKGDKNGDIVRKWRDEMKKNK